MVRSWKYKTAGMALFWVRLLTGPWPWPCVLILLPWGLVADLHADYSHESPASVGCVSSSAHLPSGFDLLGLSWLLISLLENLLSLHRGMCSGASVTRIRGIFLLHFLRFSKPWQIDDFGQVVVCMLHLIAETEVRSDHLFCFQGSKTVTWWFFFFFNIKPQF